MKYKDAMPHTRAAMVVYEAESKRVDTLLAAARTNEDVIAASELDKAAVTVFREAFYADTREVNTREQAFLVHPRDEWIRGMLAASDAP